MFPGANVIRCEGKANSWFNDAVEFEMIHGNVIDQDIIYSM